MNRYYITFGQRYAYEQHPVGGHPDGWFEVVAHDEMEARTIALKVLGQAWSNLYSAEEFKESMHMYKKGCLKHIK